MHDIDGIDGLHDAFGEQDYVADARPHHVGLPGPPSRSSALLEGEAKVGKTELAKVLAAVLGTRLIRLQCYEGLDVSTAVYEWNYPRQMLEIEGSSRRRASSMTPAPATSSPRASCCAARCPGARRDRWPGTDPPRR